MTTATNDLRAKKELQNFYRGIIGNSNFPIIPL